MNRPSHAGLRHLALNVRDMAAMKRFYIDLLGFAVEWEPDADNVYLSSGIDNLALHRSPSPASGGRRRNAAIFTARSSRRDRAISQRRRSVGGQFLEGHGVVIDAKPRTHRDGARSCYFRDPDGNKIQVIHHPPIADKA